ncbi:MAG: hypothetical protein ABI629_05535 [bacterium]
MVDKPKQERVIHARIPESLDDEVKRRATDLGLSVSNLVRNVLQHTFGLVEDVVHDSAEIARAARGGQATRSATPSTTDRAGAPPAPRVLGWQRVVLNVNAICDTCNAVLTKGSRAAVGMLDRPGTPPVQCTACLKELDHDDDH